GAILKLFLNPKPIWFPPYSIAHQESERLFFCNSQFNFPLPFYINFPTIIVTRHRTIAAIIIAKKIEGNTIIMTVLPSTIKTD
ncbi:hypothetical protein, partial [Bacillus sp. 7884-1]|uniref:hypothetical protein n=1 Tax=Bacillus sp. 7884-1 TaxID=2021693 RepID=UPI000BDAD5EF